MADKNLILGARLAAGGFNTGLADAVDKSIARATENIASIYEAQAEANAEVDRRAFAILDKFPPEINFAKLPPAERKALQGWATTKKEEYFKKAQELAKMKVNSPNFLTTQNELNAIKQAYINANDNLLKAQAYRTTYSTDRRGENEQGLVLSQSMHGENIGFTEYDEVFLPESPTGAGYSVEYDNFGNPTYSVGDKSFTLDQVDFNYRDDKAIGIFDALSKNAQNLGAKGVQFKEKTAEYNEAATNIDRALLNNNSIKSILNDNVFSFLNLTPEEITGYKQDLPKARKELKSKLLFHLGELNKNTYAGYTAKLNAQNNNNNITAGDAFNLDAFKGTFNNAVNFIESNPSAEQIKNLIIRTNIEDAGKYATGKELNANLVNKEDGYDENALYIYSSDADGDLEATAIPLDSEAIFDIYMNAYGAPADVTAKYKQQIGFNNTTPNINNNIKPLDLKNIFQNMPDGRVQSIDRSNRPFKMGGSDREFKELIESMKEGSLDRNQI